MKITSANVNYNNNDLKTTNQNDNDIGNTEPTHGPMVSLSHLFCLFGFFFYNLLLSALRIFLAGWGELTFFSFFISSSREVLERIRRKKLLPPPSHIIPDTSRCNGRSNTWNEQQHKKNLHQYRVNFGSFGPISARLHQMQRPHTDVANDFRRCYITVTKKDRNRNKLITEITSLNRKHR